MNSITHHRVLHGLQPASPPSWLDRVQGLWAAWREQSRRDAEWRTLEQLSDSTRRDIGLADRTPIAPNPPLWDHERGTW